MMCNHILAVARAVQRIGWVLNQSRIQNMKQIFHASWEKDLLAMQKKLSKAVSVWKIYLHFFFLWIGGIIFGYHSHHFYHHYLHHNRHHPYCHTFCLLSLSILFCFSGFLFSLSINFFLICPHSSSSLSINHLHLLSYSLSPIC